MGNRLRRKRSSSEGYGATLPSSKRAEGPTMQPSSTDMNATDDPPATSQAPTHQICTHRPATATTTSTDPPPTNLSATGTSPATSPPTDCPTTSPPNDPPAPLPTNGQPPATSLPIDHPAIDPPATSTSPPTNPLAISPSANPSPPGLSTDHAPPSLPNDPPSSSLQALLSLQSTRPRVLKGSDLPALMTILGDSAYLAYQLGIQIGLLPDLVLTLEQQALMNPFKLLSLVLGTRMKQTSPPLTLKTLVDALRKPPIHKETLALRLLQDFVSVAGPEQPLVNPSGVPMSPVMAAYSEFLDIEYQLAAIPPDPKGGPTPSTKYTNLAVIKKEKVSSAEADAFTKATFHGGINEIMHHKKAIELKDIFKPEDGQANVNFVLAEGVPGVGKSTMAWQLCRMRHEIEATKAFAAIVLLRLREKEVQEAKSVAELLYHDDPDIQQAVVKEICSTIGENVLFILDGFDEVPRDLRKSMFAAKIISGKCLRKATVLVTSRPSARADLLSLRKPDKHIEILGFTHELIEQYASSVFGSSTPLLADFLKYVSTNPIVKSMMYVPLNCAIVVELYQENREEGRPIPQTMTQLYSELTLTLIRRHHKENGGQLESFPTKLEDLSVKHPESHAQLVILAELAFNAIQKQEVIFEELPADCSTLGLMTTSQQLYVSSHGSTSYSFFHLSVQEFLSAYYISQLAHSEQKRAFKGYLETARSIFSPFLYNVTDMDVVWRFVAGLTGFSSIGWDLVHPERGMDVAGFVSTFFIEFLYEAQQKAQCHECLRNPLSQLEFSTRSAFDSFAGGYCVAISWCTWHVNIGSPEYLAMFVYGLKSQENVHGSISRLVLKGNPIGQKDIAQLKEIPLRRLLHLDLCNCKLDGSALDQLSDLIPIMTSLEELDISGNPVGNGGTVKLLQTLRIATTSHLCDLQMKSIPIGCDDIMALSHLIKPSGELKQLEIGDPHMQWECIELMLKVVFASTSLETLLLYNMNFDTTSLSFTPLKGNSNITQLIIQGGTVGSKDLSSIAEVLCENTTLKILVLGDLFYGVQIESDRSRQVTHAVSGLANALKVNRSLEDLWLYLEGDGALGRKEARSLISALQYNQTLKKLRLSHSFIKHFVDKEHKLVDSRVTM